MMAGNQRKNETLNKMNDDNDLFLHNFFLSFYRSTLISQR